MYKDYCYDLNKIDDSNSAYKIKIESFNEWCKGYNKKFYKEYFNND